MIPNSLHPVGNGIYQNAEWMGELPRLPERHNSLSYVYSYFFNLLFILLDSAWKQNSKKAHKNKKQKTNKQQTIIRNKKNNHLNLGWASQLSSFQFFPCSLISSYRVHLHIPRGLPFFLFPQLVPIKNSEINELSKWIFSSGHLGADCSRERWQNICQNRE